ncbi:hypothetical protein ABVK25_001341 [Lepraria finkii]|uniref:Uncharacterized protein n=1 Tax=Lepraria finkii TaxID=1340010 RepID=A0ABR4BQX6_9LECA
MFCITLRQRPDLASIIPLLTASTTLRLRETTLGTHDLALPLTISTPQNIPQTQVFLILTSSSLGSPRLLERISHFSKLAYPPAPAIAFLLGNGQEDHGSAGNGMHAYMQLQTLTHTLSTPPPILPISSSERLLPLLMTYIAPPQPPASTPPLPSPLLLLSHTTSTAPPRPLPMRVTYVLSDLCHSLREVLELAQTDKGRETLGQWVGAGETRGLAEFWEGEWICEGRARCGQRQSSARVKSRVQCHQGYFSPLVSLPSCYNA